jgi:hypothetical protein
MSTPTKNLRNSTRKYKVSKDREIWLEVLSDYPSEGEEERLWHCLHGRAYGINCKKCERDDDE